MANFRNLPSSLWLRRDKLRQAQTGDPPEGWGVQAQRGQILILKILQCIPVVKIFAFLDLAQIFSFMNGH